ADGGLVCSTAPKSIDRPSDQVLAQAALDELTVTLGADVAALVDDDLAAGDHGGDVAVDLEALPRRAVHDHVVDLPPADRRVAVGVVDDDVGVGPRLDDPLLAVEPEHAGGRRRGDLDPPFEADLAVDHPLVEQVHAVFDRADAVRDLGEVAEAELLLALH